MMIEKLSSEFPFQTKFIENLIRMADEGDTVPFIARYRKEQTGAMDEIQIREVLERCEYLRNLEKRKEEVLKLIEERGKLTPELQQKIIAADTLALVEDLYAPYKSKKKTKADIAREAGLQPLADFICASLDLTGLYEEAEKYVNPTPLEGIATVSDADTAISMARDIIIEQIGHNLDVKQRIRELYQANALLKSVKSDEIKERTTYEAYYDFDEKVATIPPHRVMAIFRGEREAVLKVQVEMDEDSCLNAVTAISREHGIQLNTQTEKAVNRALKVMLMPSVELEIRAMLKETGEERAIQVFADNLKRLIMTPPVKGRIVLGLDPAFRTGCKFAVVNVTGTLLDYGVIYPVQPQNDYEGSKRTLLALINKHKVNAIAIGNGTASRETEEFVAQMITDGGLDVPYTIVNEAGASVYSASEVAAKEFPDLDVTIRGAVSIARRVIDPLAELVKIEPRSIGVGMYQHDVNKKKLENSLNAVVEDVVNSVGVNLNTASPSLLSYVSGLNNNLANKIVQFREKAGRFTCREELLKIAGLGEKIYRQCAGFLKVYDGKEPLDAMFIHPESYGAVHNLLKQFNLPPEHAMLVRKMIKVSMENLAKDLGVGEYTLRDIIDNLEKPDRDVRDTVEPVVFKKDVVNLESLTVGMLLDGKVTNVVDFGAFVDIGLKNDGLVHISELANHYVKSPKDVVSVGQRLKVKVLTIDKERGRVGLSARVLGGN